MTYTLGSSSDLLDGIDHWPFLVENGPTAAYPARDGSTALLDDVEDGVQFYYNNRTGEMVATGIEPTEGGEKKKRNRFSFRRKILAKDKISDEGSGDYSVDDPPTAYQTSIASTTRSCARERTAGERELIDATVIYTIVLQRLAKVKVINQLVVKDAYR